MQENKLLSDKTLHGWLRLCKKSHNYSGLYDYVSSKPPGGENSEIGTLDSAYLEQFERPSLPQECCSPAVSQLGKKHDAQTKKQ